MFLGKSAFKQVALLFKLSVRFRVASTGVKPLVYAPCEGARRAGLQDVEAVFS